MSDRGSSEVIIGVTGHRILDSPKSIISGVDEALHVIQSSFHAEHMAVISPLAEGTDRVLTEKSHPSVIISKYVESHQSWRIFNLNTDPIDGVRRIPGE